jgi:hypothetical protein
MNRVGIGHQFSTTKGTLPTYIDLGICEDMSPEEKPMRKKKAKQESGKINFI